MAQNGAPKGRRLWARASGGKFMLLVLPSCEKLSIEDQASELIAHTSGGKFMLLILPPGEQLSIEDQIFEFSLPQRREVRVWHKTTPPKNVGCGRALRAVSLCLSFCLRARS